MEQLHLPEKIRERVAGQAYAENRTGLSGAGVIMFENAVLKIQPVGEEARTEKTMLAWLQGKLPVPQIIASAEQDGRSYLLTTRERGEMACAEQFMQKPEQLAAALAGTLRRMWQLDVSDCPVMQRSGDKIKRAERALKQTKQADAEKMRLLETLKRNMPQETLVFSHGDLCLPNILLDEDGLCALVDLGRAGAGDQWQDIALCLRSLEDNFAGKYGGRAYEGFRAEMLFEALEMQADPEKLRYYQALDELP